MAQVDRRDCFTDDVLRDYLDNRLDLATSNELECHVVRCALCSASIYRIHLSAALSIDAEDIDVSYKRFDDYGRNVKALGWLQERVGWGQW
jgi:hypothetical protein